MPALPEETDNFQRGDANGDGSRNIADAVKILGFLFGQPGGLICEDALDSNDSGNLNIADAISLLDYLFRPESATLAPPASSCGVDPTMDTLICEGPSACQ